MLDLRVLPPETYEAFALKPLRIQGGGGVIGPVVERTPPEPMLRTERAAPVSLDAQGYTSTTTSDAKTAGGQRRTVFEEWGQENKMPQATARQVRGWTWDAMMAFLPWTDLLLESRHLKRDLRRIYLPNARGGSGRRSSTDAFVVVATDSELAEPVRKAKITEVLMALARRYAIYELGLRYGGRGLREDSSLPRRPSARRIGRCCGSLSSASRCARGSCPWIVSRRARAGRAETAGLTT